RLLEVRNLFQACGFTLAVGGMLVLFDSERVLLSKLLSTEQLSPSLPHPLLYYIAIGLSLLGLLIAGTGILGCWASCMNNYCMLTLFNCCGIESANEYDTSLWRLQALGPSLAVPLTCCTLENGNQSRAYLNPEPINSNLCQALERNRHEGYRHTAGCKDYLDQWYREHYVIFLGLGLGIVLVEFMVLLSTILTCTRIYLHKQETKDLPKNSRQELESSASTRETTFKRSPSSQAGAYSNETYAMTGSFRPNYRLMDRA
ncbi:hypothetical protein NQ318_016889, partial [Aromia moschata]